MEDKINENDKICDLKRFNNWWLMINDYWRAVYFVPECFPEVCKGTEKDSNEAVDTTGDPGWGKVDQLAESLKSLSVTTSQVDTIIKMYEWLMENY